MQGVKYQVLVLPRLTFGEKWRWEKHFFRTEVAVLSLVQEWNLKNTPEKRLDGYNSLKFYHDVVYMSGNFSLIISQTNGHNILPKHE